MFMPAGIAVDPGFIGGSGTRDVLLYQLCSLSLGFPGTEPGHLHLWMGSLTLTAQCCGEVLGIKPFEFSPPADSCDFIVVSVKIT